MLILSIFLVAALNSGFCVRLLRAARPWRLVAQVISGGHASLLGALPAQPHHHPPPPPGEPTNPPSARFTRTKRECHIGDPSSRHENPSNELSHGKIDVHTLRMLILGHIPGRSQTTAIYTTPAADYPAVSYRKSVSRNQVYGTGR